VRKIRTTSLASAAVACIALSFAAQAGATRYKGSVTDPVNGHYPANDVLQETMSFDNSTGTWVEVLKFRGSALPTTNVQIYIEFDTGSLNSAGEHDRQPFYEIAVRGGKMKWVDRTVSLWDYHFDFRRGIRFCVPKVTLSRPRTVLTATVVDPCLAGLVPKNSTGTYLSYKTVMQNWVSRFNLLPLS